MLRYSSEAIKAAAQDPERVAGVLGLKVQQRTRTGVRVLCPWHREKNASCHLLAKDGCIFVHCFACQEGGDVLALAGAVWGMDLDAAFPELCERLGAALGLRPDEEVRERARAPEPKVRADAGQQRRAEAARAWEKARARRMARPADERLADAAQDWISGRAIRDDLEGITPRQMLEASRALAAKALLEVVVRRVGMPPTEDEWEELVQRARLRGAYV